MDAKPLTGAEFERRKAELEKRDGKIVPPDVLVIAKRLVWKSKVRRGFSKMLAARGKRGKTL